jgi:uncharacterized protein (TIGR03435 family)
MVRAAGLVIILSHAAFAQASAKAPEFEVADVRVNKSISPDGGKFQFLPGGHIDVSDVTVKSIIMAAYDVQEDMITGGPGWIDSEHYDIVAQAPPDTPREALRLMLRPLLAERFKLATHREDKPMPVYAMMAAKDGPKLQKTAGGAQQCRWNNSGADLVRRECRNTTMEELASSMPRWGMAGKVDLPVVDLTGIKGAYDFQLEWSAPGGDADPGSSVFDAMGQIGLKLEQRKYPISVIDHVERVPGAN